MKKAIIMGVIVGIAVLSPVLAMSISPIREALLGLTPEEQILTIADRIEEDKQSTQEEVERLESMIVEQGEIQDKKRECEKRCEENRFCVYNDEKHWHCHGDIFSDAKIGCEVEKGERYKQTDERIERKKDTIKEIEDDIEELEEEIDDLENCHDADEIPDLKECEKKGGCNACGSRSDSMIKGKEKFKEKEEENKKIQERELSEMKEQRNTIESHYQECLSEADSGYALCEEMSQDCNMIFE